MIPNIVSLLRIPLAFLLVWQPVLAITFACISDILDGYLARKLKSASYLGTIIDPFCDKFFALFALFFLLYKEQITLLETALFLSREWALLTYLSIQLLQMKKVFIKAFISGKVMTSFQFVALIILYSGFTLPDFFYWVFAILGCTSLFELLNRRELNRAR